MKSRFLLASFLALFSFFYGFAQTNETEPNNTAAAANIIAVSATGNGHISTPTDVDWWKITLGTDGKLDVAVTDKSDDYTNFYLYDNNGTIVLNSGTVGSHTSNTYSKDGLAAGTYYIEFTAYNTNSDTSTYSFTTTLTPPPAANDAEPDSTRAQALTLPLNGSVTGHVGYYYNNHRDSSDWYKVTLNSDGLLRLRITTEPSSLNAYVNYYLYDNNGTTLIRSNTIGANTTADFNTDGLAAGTYYVRMSQYDINVDYVSYVLADSLFTPPVANDAEPDSTRAQALTLPLDGKVTGHVGYYYNNHRDSSDWYKVTTTSDGLLRLRITTEPSSLNAYVNYYLYDNNGTILINSNTVGSNTTTDFNTDGLAAGTYYVKISQYDINVDYVSYVLADSLFTPPVANDAELNNSTATADSFPLNAAITGHVGYYYNNHRDTLDWYKVITNTDGMLQFTITTEPSSLNAYINYALYDTDGTTLITSSTIGSNTTNVYNIDGLMKGTYYLRMYQYNVNDYVSYKVKDSLFTYQYAADSSYEPNAYALQAKTILSNRTTTGHFGFYVNGGRTTDNADWFRLNYTGTGSLSFTLNHLPHISDGGNDYVNFYVYKDTSAAPVYSITFGSETTDNVNLTGLSEGYYYIKIAQYSGGDFEAYSLSNSFTQVDTASIAIAGTSMAPNTCSSGSITYQFGKSHSPYGVTLYRNGVKYDSANVATDTLSFNNLPAGVYYATVYGDGATDAAYGKSGTTTLLPPTPTGLSTSDTTTTSITLHWTPLSCVDDYTIQYHKTGVATWTSITVKNDTTGSYNLKGLTNYTSYEWRIASLDSAAGSKLMSPYSDSMMFITLSNPARIALFRSVQTNACNSDTLKYRASNSIAPYTVQLYRDSVPYGSPVSVTDTAIFSGLPSGVYYATANGTGSGDTTGKSASTTLAPPFPTNLTTDSISSTTAMLNWTPLTCVSYFTVQYKVSTSGTFTNTITVPADSSSYYLTGLTPGTTYNWRISSVDTTNGQFIVSSYSSNATFKTMAALPVTLVTFNAKPVNNTVQLSWQTANEINSKYFAVQRSADGIVFTTVGTVSAFGNSNAQHQYSFTDNSPVKGTNYYRLRQVDNDGRFVDSKTITISFTGTSLFTLYPNPAVSTVYISLSVIGKSTITVYDNNGKAVIQKVIPDGTTSQKINVSSLAAGVYTVVLQQTDGRQSLKFVKQ